MVLGYCLLVACSARKGSLWVAGVRFDGLLVACCWRAGSGPRGRAAGRFSGGAGRGQPLTGFPLASATSALDP